MFALLRLCTSSPTKYLYLAGKNTGTLCKAPEEGGSYYLDNPQSGDPSGDNKFVCTNSIPDYTGDDKGDFKFYVLFLEEFTLESYDKLTGFYDIHLRTRYTEDVVTVPSINTGFSYYGNFISKTKIPVEFNKYTFLPNSEAQLNVDGTIEVYENNVLTQVISSGYYYTLKAGEYNELVIIASNVILDKPKEAGQSIKAKSLYIPGALILDDEETITSIEVDFLLLGINESPANTNTKLKVNKKVYLPSIKGLPFLQSIVGDNKLPKVFVNVPILAALIINTGTEITIDGKFDTAKVESLTIVAPILGNEDKALGTIGIGMENEGEAGCNQINFMFYNAGKEIPGDAKECEIKVIYQPGSVSTPTTIVPSGYKNPFGIWVDESYSSYTVKAYKAKGMSVEELEELGEFDYLELSADNFMQEDGRELSGGGLGGGAIAAIVIAVVVVVGGIAGFLVYWFLFRGKKDEDELV